MIRTWSAGRMDGASTCGFEPSRFWRGQRFFLRRAVAKSGCRTRRDRQRQPCYVPMEQVGKWDGAKHAWRLPALTIRLDQLIRDGEVADLAELARPGHVSRARLLQIMNLLDCSHNGFACPTPPRTEATGVELRFILPTRPPAALHRRRAEGLCGNAVGRRRVDRKQGAL
jgi:hypothetical protein